jgi:hypothetical protein
MPNSTSMDFYAFASMLESFSLSRLKMVLQRGVTSNRIEELQVTLQDWAKIFKFTNS